MGPRGGGGGGGGALFKGGKPRAPGLLAPFVFFTPGRGQGKCFFFFSPACFLPGGRGRGGARFFLKKTGAKKCSHFRGANGKWKILTKSF